MLVRTSNPGAADLLDVPLATGERLWERLARMVAELGASGPIADVGAVIGATEPQHLARARELMPATPFLLPGIGAQGGDVAALARRVRARPGRRARHRVALDRQRPRASASARRRTRPAPRPSGCASRHGG